MSIVFDRSNTNLAKPQSLYKQKEITNRFFAEISVAEMLSLFSVSEVFATAKVKLCYAQ